MTALRVAAVAWIVAALVAAPLNAFVLGFADDGNSLPIVKLELGGAGVAAVTGVVGLRRPSIAFARWSVLLALLWLVASFLGAPAYRFSADQSIFVWLPAVAPLVAGGASLFWLARSGAARRRDLPD